jgi:hypothetical protein
VVNAPFGLAGGCVCSLDTFDETGGSKRYCGACHLTHGGAARDSFRCVHKA